MSEPRVIHMMSAGIYQDFADIKQNIRMCVEVVSGDSRFTGDAVKFIEYSAYQELKEKLKVAEETFESIIKYKISGSDVYQAAESIQIEAREALRKIRGE